MSNSSDTTSSSTLLPTASTFPELLNSSVLAALQVSTQLSSTTVRPSFVSAASKEQLPSTTPKFDAGNAILNLVSMLFIPGSSRFSTQDNRGSGKAQATSSANSTQPKSVLSSVSSNQTKPTPLISHIAEVLIQTESNSVSTMAPVISEKPAMLKRHRSLSAAAGVSPRRTSRPGDGKSTAIFLPNFNLYTPRNENTLGKNVSSKRFASKHAVHKAGHHTTAVYTRTSKVDDEKTSTNTRTVTRFVTITMPASGMVTQVQRGH